MYASEFYGRTLALGIKAALHFNLNEAISSKLAIRKYFA
jgi:hypothetical protein